MNLAENLNKIYSGVVLTDESVEINNPEIPKNAAENLLSFSEASKKPYDLMFAGFGNGLSVVDKNREESGDYMKIAHIDRKRKIKYYKKNLPPEVKREIEKEAKAKNSPMSTSQPDKMTFDEGLSSATDLINHYEGYDFETNMYTANKPSFDKYQRDPNDTFEYCRVLQDGQNFRIRSANGKITIPMNADEAAATIYGVMAQKMTDVSNAQAYLDDATKKVEGSVFEANSKLLYNMLEGKWDDDYQDADGSDSKNYVTI